jgi:alpha(1,3/1,4) fucosyltransferase
VAFARFWQGFDPEAHLFTRLLKNSFEVRLGDDPDVVFFSVFPGEMPPGQYVKVFYTGECARPPWSECDWAFSFDYDDHPRHYRLPNYVTAINDPRDLIKTPDKVADWLRNKTKFCNFVYSRPSRRRDVFFERLSRRKAVDAPGRAMNNMPAISAGDPSRSRDASDWPRTKIAFLSRYKFTIAFENQTYPGYTTEKIYHAMQAGSVPIYWGDPLVDRDFNPRSFISYHQHEAAVMARLPSFLLHTPLLSRLVDRYYVQPKTMERLIDQVLTVDANDALYAQCLSEPWFHANAPPPFFDLRLLERRLGEIAVMAIGARQPSDEAPR